MRRCQSYVLSVQLGLCPVVWSAADFHDPEFESGSFKVVEGYSVNLFAAEPMVVKPIQMQFDPQGRLWVLCTTIYPQIQPGKNPNDKLVILEDKDGDGRAEKSTEFASGLTIPTGFALGQKGAYVGQGTELVHLQDTDGDGRADQTRVVLSGFGTGDSHQNINSFVWSPGGELFFSQGANSYSRVETMDGIKSLDGPGFWRFRPRTFQLESFFKERIGPANPWGTVFDDWGQPFIVDGCCHGIFYLLPVMVKKDADRFRGERYLGLWNGKKICGVDLISGPPHPKQMQGVLVGGAFFSNAVGLWRINEHDSGFGVEELSPLIESTNASFRVVDVKVGPDGAIYLADWYNPIVGHYQYSFRHPLRDKIHGRIWRVAVKDHPTPSRPASRGGDAPQLVDIPIEQLFDYLKAPERQTRYQAKRMLCELPADKVVRALGAWLKTLDAVDAQYEHYLFEALGVYEAHEYIEPEFLDKLLRARDYRARAYATRVVGHWHRQLNNALGLLERRIRDEHPRVRLEAVVALSYISSPRAMEVALAAVDRPMDRFLEYALRLTVQGLRPHWKDRFTAGQFNFDNQLKRVEFLIRADPSPELTVPLVKLIKSKSLAGEGLPGILAVLTEVGSAEDLAIVLNPDTYFVSGRYDANIHADILRGLARAYQVRRVRPAGDLAGRLSALLERSEESLLVEVLKLSGLWKLEPLRARVANLAMDTRCNPAVRAAAIEALASLAGQASQTALRQLTGPGQPEAIRISAMKGLALLDLEVASLHAAQALAMHVSDSAAADLVSAFLARTGGAEALGRALEERQPGRNEAKVGLRLMNQSGRHNRRLAEVLRRAAGLESETVELRAGELSGFVSEMMEQGDPERGEMIYRRAELNCLGCHAIGGAGGRAGPDLSAIGSGQPADFIVGAVLEPNREIKEGYLAYEVSTKDGEVYQGYKVREDDREVVVRDILQNSEVRIGRDQIERDRAIGSLMPAGLVSPLTRTELRDLIRFLSELGKPGPYAVYPDRVARQWRAMVEVPEDWLDTDSENVARLLAQAPSERWVAVYSRVNGELPLEEVPKSGRRGAAAVGFDAEFSGAGSVELKLNSTGGLRVLVDGRAVLAKPELALTLPEGRHQFIFLIECAKRQARGLRAQFLERPDSAARISLGLNFSH